VLEKKRGSFQRKREKPIFGCEKSLSLVRAPGSRPGEEKRVREAPTKDERRRESVVLKSGAQKKREGEKRLREEHATSRASKVPPVKEAHYTRESSHRGGKRAHPSRHARSKKLIKEEPRTRGLLRRLERREPP